MPPAGSVVAFVSKAEYDRRAVALDETMRALGMTNDALGEILCCDEKDVRRLRRGAGRITDAKLDAMGAIGVAVRARLAKAPA